MKGGSWAGEAQCSVQSLLPDLAWDRTRFMELFWSKWLYRSRPILPHARAVLKHFLRQAVCPVRCDGKSVLSAYNAHPCTKSTSSHTEVRCWFDPLRNGEDKAKSNIIIRGARQVLCCTNLFSFLRRARMDGDEKGQGLLLRRHLDRVRPKGQMSKCPEYL